MEQPKRTVRVAAAIIGNGSEIFATQRGYGAYKDYWEFPGGKIEPGETPEQAIVREIHEELSAVIRVERHFMTVEYEYPTFHLSMKCFLASVVSGELKLLEHESAAWLSRDRLRSVNWLPADLLVVEQLERER
ncbi:MAG: (deoxy)nucleoside triphosphate pyrophosphohydrolase [Clostridia bacterium]|nr:(deoxy)nucleoside triphosphate pyrophosphohydrolase [Clostridia bacterium]